MNASFQLDSYHYKCRSCHKSHAGPTRPLDFHCVQEKLLEHGVERIYEAGSTFHCACAQPITITFSVREHPEGNFAYHGYQSANADVIVAPKVREHMEYVEF
jgi:hypothetical protein